MPITSSWTAPALLDRNNGDLLSESIWDNLVSNELYLWDTLHNYARAAAVLSFTIGAADTNLYRAAANLLKTDDAFAAGDNIVAKQNGTGQVAIGDVAGAATIQFGSVGDTNLYRAAANLLKTDDAFVAVDNIVAKFGLAGQVSIGDLAGSPAVLFGSAGDTNLYRSAADTLKTDDGLVVVGALSAPNVWTRLAETVLGAAAASITLASIPATYRHLRLVVQTRSTVAGIAAELRFRFNNDATASYSYQYHWSMGTTSATDGPATTNQGILAVVPGATGMANLRAVADVTIADYVGASYKSLVSSFHGQSGTDAIHQAVGQVGCIWASTVVINRIDLFLSTGNLDTGTVATVYGC